MLCPNKNIIYMKTKEKKEKKMSNLFFAVLAGLLLGTVLTSCESEVLENKKTESINQSAELYSGSVDGYSSRSASRAAKRKTHSGEYSVTSWDKHYSFSFSNGYSVSFANTGSNTIKLIFQLTDCLPPNVPFSGQEYILYPRHNLTISNANISGDFDVTYQCLNGGQTSTLKTYRITW